MSEGEVDPSLTSPNESRRVEAENRRETAWAVELTLWRSVPLVVMLSAPALPQTPPQCHHRPGRR